MLLDAKPQAGTARTGCAATGAKGQTWRADPAGSRSGPAAAVAAQHNASLEGAAVAWVGLRQGRLLARCFGYLLQFAQSTYNAGLTIALGLAFGIEYLDDSIKTPEDVTKRLKLPLDKLADDDESQNTRLAIVYRASLGIEAATAAQVLAEGVCLANYDGASYKGGDHQRTHRHRIHHHRAGAGFAAGIVELSVRCGQAGARSDTQCVLDPRVAVRAD